ncbi:putative O-glycosylation ligase, exosortase A system-associated [Vibrio algarum]|uniref:O-glycosylation ligase, exosortase A system-associated n=1 Tax=Vibrio algarum TaxID=3020714 RepID=A0ABT4YQ83_9VIBR|nr:putative O-glycosylation ligase, exosortase A system-associated [Vibrio sp. KJ40-1]MDB1123712.1 putative O-glycosylation ligase, exosortase A system-associated [Vibrio sp. KJ40-1]
MVVVWPVCSHLLVIWFWDLIQLQRDFCGCNDHFLPICIEKKPRFQLTGVFLPVMLFYFHTTISSVLTIALPEFVWRTWQDFSKVILLFIMTCLILRKQHHFDFFIWAIVLSVGFYGSVEGLKFLASGGGHNIAGPKGHLIHDNNHLALALCMTLPLIIYLSEVTKEKIIKLALYGMLIVCIFAILGTFSRGGFLGLVVVSAYFWYKSKSRLRNLIIILFVTSITVAFVLPERWFNRMDTIETAVVEDSSFLGRLNSWKIHTLMAIDRPLIGGGFKACQFGYIWRRLALDIDTLDFIETPPPSNKGLAAHSIYFQVLGDHGFTGLLLFLSMLATSFFKLNGIVKYYRKRFKEKRHWAGRLAEMTRLSLLAYGSAGAALSMAYFELIYAILALTVCLTLVQQSEVNRDKDAVKLG